MSSNFVDLTVARHQPDGYSDEEDEAAFGYEWKYRRLYREIWRINQNDPNFGRLCLDCSDISEAMCERVGTYLWTSQHMKSLELQGLTGNNLRNLFGKIASQNETNDFIIKKDVLSNIVDNEKTLMHSIIESVTSFTKLVNVRVFGNNNFGIHETDVLVKALAGSSIEGLVIKGNSLYNGINPFLGLRKCQRLKELKICGGRVGDEDLETLMALFDNGYPRLRELGLQNCGIRDDHIERVGPILARNKSLRLLLLDNNDIRGRGVAALTKAVHDTSSFKKTFASNNTIWKIMLSDTEVSNRLFWITSYHADTSAERGRRRAAWRKYVSHFSKNNDADWSPFLDTEIKLIPRVLSRIGACNSKRAMFKIWLSRQFRDKLDTASQMQNLRTRNGRFAEENEKLKRSQTEDKGRIKELIYQNSRLTEETARLKEKIAALTLAQNCTKSENPGMANESIAERLKTRKNARKRGRK